MAMMYVSKTWYHLRVPVKGKIGSNVECSVFSAGILKDVIPVDDNEPTSLMVRVWDIIWILTCDWQVGRLSVERDLTSCRELFSSVRLFSSIFVLMKTLEIYAELSPLIPNDVRRIFADVTLTELKLFECHHDNEIIMQFQLVLFNGGGGGGPHNGEEVKGRYIMCSGKKKIYYKKTVRKVFTKPVQIDGTTKSFFFSRKLHFIVVHISAARRCECM
jgi:hypothetical protein